MELKNFQKAVINDLTRFLALLNETSSIPVAYRTFWETNTPPVPVGFGGMNPYKNILPGVPNVCLKVPTGGGKTFIAANAIKPIFDSLPHNKTKAVAWLVPSDAILEQTIKSLSDPHHPYRYKINTDFSHRVSVYTKTQLLFGQDFNPTTVNERLSVFVLSYDSFRAKNREGRKVFQENGCLAEFAKFFNDPSILLAGTDETALIQVIRHLNPVVIVDESHNASSSLSKEMLLNFNPSFVLDLTATPKNESNIISFVDARRLKNENMVKLPVIVYNRRTQSDVFSEAITAQRKLEVQAQLDRQKTGRYIRPIVLFQAEPKGNDKTTFDKVKKALLDLEIPSNQIAIKTGDDKKDLRGVDLLSEDCPIRYIITVNALKEGWDCPFAYVLATVANRKSSVDVEQILGRILRLPYTKKNENMALNISYVITSSSDFQDALKKIIKGLNDAGFSEKEYRTGTMDEPLAAPTPTEGEQLPIPLDDTDDDITVDIEAVRARLEALEREPQQNISEDPMFAPAIEEATNYESAIQESGNLDFEDAPSEVRPFMNTKPMNKEFEEDALQLRLPQFFVPNDNMPEHFGLSKTELLTKEALLGNFTLNNKDTMIDFSALDAEIVRVDLEETEEAIPKAFKLKGIDSQYYREWFNSQSSERRIQECNKIIIDRLSKIIALSNKELGDYVCRVMEVLTPEQLEDLQQSPVLYYEKIKKKIEELMDKHSETVFERWVEQSKITCDPSYTFKKAISPARTTSAYPKSLYTAEAEMNEWEEKIVWELSNMENIRWWHRNISRSGFNINGYVNAFPDIIAMTKSGKILVIEPKGKHLDNTDSAHKAKVGKQWEKLAGRDYRYYMVFKESGFQVKDAVTLERFLEIVREL